MKLEFTMKYILTLLIPCLFLQLSAQKTTSELYLDLEKMASLKRVLYLAAHPDDENTRALAWLSLGENAQTAYLSLTRGDGGQNLIGNELGAELGILRSQELLAARGIDNAQQFFSRAVDFGYSRSAEESFKKWEKGAVLSDVVRVIRKFKPDVIITRFPPDERAGHGHHTASAMLAIEAAKLANDKTFLSNELNKDLDLWEPTSVYWNSSYWWDKDIAETAADNPDYLTFDIGAYNSTIGKSYNEIGTLARSQHKCQGFGSIIERGERIEYFQHLSGEKLEKSFFEKSTRTWENIVSADLAKDFETVLVNFDFIDASKNIPILLKIYDQLKKIDNEFLRNEKLKQCQNLITNCLGLNIELLADDYSFSTGTDVALTLSIINRSTTEVKLLSATINSKSFTPTNQDLASNKIVDNEFSITAAEQYYNPYWLQQPYENLFEVLNVSEIGNPSSDASIGGKIQLKIGDQVFDYPIHAEYKWSDPSFGERRRDVVFTPSYAITLDQSSILAKTGTSKTIQVKAKSYTDKFSDQIILNAPKGWEISPKTIDLNFDKKHQEKVFDIKITASKDAESGPLKFVNKTEKAIQLVHEISYDHIPTQIYFSNATMNLVKINAEIVQGKIGYIKGVEEKVPQAIEQLGYDVTIMEIDNLSSYDLKQFETVVVGIRAYNVKPELLNFKDDMMSYVKQGGNLIVQYNTASRAVKEMDLGPFPFKISRDRVTEEDAAVTFVDPAHELLNQPNKITQKDFENWVQERGLYFASDWDENYKTIISWGDTGQEQVEGGLIVTNYGEGHYIYTGISFFRELPNGVEGAYRLFANLLSYGRN